jgi:hypothetical protein
LYASGFGTSKGHGEPFGTLACGLSKGNTEGMAESAIILELLLHLLIQFLVGAIVGASIGKDRASAPRGIFITMGLTILVIAYGIAVATLAFKSVPNNPGLTIVRVLGAVVGSLCLGFCPVSICLLVACAGYWSAFVVFRRLGIGPNRITLASIFAFITILAGITAIATIARH